MALAVQPVCVVEHKEQNGCSGGIRHSGGCKLVACVGGKAYGRNVGDAVRNVRHNVGQDPNDVEMRKGRTACDTGNDADTERERAAAFVLLYNRLHNIIFIYAL